MSLYYGWWVVFASGGIVFLTVGTFVYGFSALVNPLTAEFGWSRAVISGAFSLRTEIGGLAAPVSGFLVDRLGPRRLLLAGVFLVGCGFIFLSRVESVWAFYAAVMVIATGMSATGGLVAMTAVAHWFRKRRGRALAITTAASGSSGVMVVVLAWLISTFDWRTALLMMGLIQWAVCIPLALVVRHRPQDMGLLPDGERPWRPEEQPAVAPASDEAKDGFTPAAETSLSLSQAMRTRSFWFIAVALSLMAVGAMAVIVHQIPFLTESAGFSDGQASLAVMSMSFTSLVGRLGFGWLADYVDKRRVLAVAYLMLALGILLLSQVSNAWHVVLFLAVFSPGWGGAIAVRPALQAELFGLRAFGSIQGLLHASATLGGVIGPIFAGWMHDTADTYRPAFVILGFITLTAAPAMLMVGRPRAEAVGAAPT
jgi:sugar phosphate permease